MIHYTFNPIGFSSYIIRFIAFEALDLVLLIIAVRINIKGHFPGI